MAALVSTHGRREISVTQDCSFDGAASWELQSDRETSPMEREQRSRESSRM